MPTFRYPKADHKKWFKAKISQIDDPKQLNRNIFGFTIPDITPDDIMAIHDFNCGSYGYKEARKYFLLLRDRELDLGKDLTWEEYTKQRKLPPEDTEVYFRVLRKKPKAWSGRDYGPFPKKGILFAYIRYTLF